MARNITVYDLENYPDNSKTLTVDQQSVVPTGYAGDEQWVLSFTTNAYSDNTSNTAIQDIYVQEMRDGWYKSSGLVTIGSTVTVSSGSKTLGVNIDNSSKWYYVELAEETYGPDALADHIEDQIRAVPTTSGWSSVDDSLSYKNAQVEYHDGKFKIISGTVSIYYSGTTRTSVAVTYSGSDTLYYDIGFDLGMGSYGIATTSVRERLVTSNYTAGTEMLQVYSTADMAVGDCLAITDGTNIDYFTLLAISGSNQIRVPTTSNNNFVGIGNSYTANKTKVQVLRIQDPDQEPAMYHFEADSIMRWGIMSIVNQIDFSS